jgi:hypothetical protein
MREQKREAWWASLFGTVGLEVDQRDDVSVAELDERDLGAGAQGLGEENLEEKLHGESFY